MRGLPKLATAQKMVDRVATQKLVHRPLFRSMAPKIEVPHKLVQISNDPNYTHMSVDVFQNTGFAIGASHFLHSLQGAGKYEILEVYGHNDKTFTTSVIQFGVNLCGHQGVWVVHGGCISTVIDELFQWTAYWTTGRIGYTANLNVNYRRPLPVERPGILTAEFEKKDGRKVPATQGGCATVSFDQVESHVPVYHGDLFQLEGQILNINNTANKAAQRKELGARWRKIQEEVDAMEYIRKDMLDVNPLNASRTTFVPVKATLVQVQNLFLPKHLNMNNTIFGGEILQWM
ncbi:hypothetical protein DYB25_005693, partial [Aphanomyces astaci]